MNSSTFSRIFRGILVVALAAPAAALADAQEEEWGAIESFMRFCQEEPEARARLEREAFHPAAMIAPTDRDPLDVLLRRTQALLNDLAGMPDTPALDTEAQALQALLAESQQRDPGDAARRDLFKQVAALRRQIAFANPLLDFTKILFLKHQRARFQHMVDQYYGFHAELEGGGVFVLENAFSAAPEARNLLENVPVEGGRLAGQPLDGGSFISLDLDYDAQTILFAWSEGEVPVEPTDYTPHADLWTLGSTYHIFKAAVDGSSLVQLTDGLWNDFDPCFLPNGRICFISERRGGYLRCGLRPNPTYTLHSMRDDGSDIIALSFHETHEWHPSVDNEGMIVYSRWDYVDRDSDIAHHLWHTYPDGRDPRSLHGNYPEIRESRPWMELSIRAIPDSRKYVAVSTPHHGQNYGSIVIIDLAAVDDNAMSQVRRLTPDIAFPESETAPGIPEKTHGGRNNGLWEVYGTPWPLSENYYLGVYDRGQKHYGLYLLDAFGNRELLYRDADNAVLDPIPLRPRTRPPVIPSKTLQAAEDKVRGADERAFLVVLNVYDSLLPWPEGTEIKALRILQLFPKTTPGAADPNIGMADQSLARGALGVVPVEADGSVYCEVPAGVPLYFQALDAQGLAVQSMRSATYLHPGETLSCVGCHEPKHRAAVKSQPMAAMALQRAPSKLKPETPADNPLSFARLVQPVLDRNCVECHTEKGAIALGAEPFGKFGWSESYQQLAPFAWGVRGGNGIIREDGSRSVPGQVGARASKLLALIRDGHEDLELPEEDLRRITLWLDSNSVFYGAYHDIEAQARGALVLPDLE